MFLSMIAASPLLPPPGHHNGALASLSGTSTALVNGHQYMRNSLPAQDLLRLYLRQISRIPLLKPCQEKQLAKRIFRMRRAFQRRALQDLGVASSLLKHLKAFQQKQTRIDSLCEVAMNEVKSRAALETKIHIHAPTIQSLIDRWANAKNQVQRRRLQNRCLRLFEELSVRQTWFEQATADDPIAERLLAEYQSACHEMASANLRLVVAVGRKFTATGVPLLDIIQEGNAGLMRAVAKFDYRRDIRFSTYATLWIRQAILSMLPNANRLIRLPAQFNSVPRRAQRLHGQLAMQLGRTPDAHDLSQAFDVEHAKARQLLAILTEPVSLDRPPESREAHHSLGSNLVDWREDEPNRIAHHNETRRMVKQSLRALNQSERKTIRLRYGLDDGVARTLADVGRQLGVTRERVRQMEQSALRKLAAKIPPPPE